MEECDIWPPRPGDPTNVLGSMNIEITPDGAVPAVDHGPMAGSVNAGNYFQVSPIETKGPSSTLNAPRQYSFCANKCFRFEDGALTTDFTFSDYVMGTLIFPCVAGGVLTNRLIAFFGASTVGLLAGGGHAWRNLGTDTTPWAYHVGAAAIQSYLARSFGPDGMLTTGAAGQGRTQLGEYNISKIVAGLYDGTTTNVGAAEPVGNGDWSVIGMAPLRHSFVAGTGAGAFMRNTIDKIYEPIRPLQEDSPHGLNTKAMTPGENSVVYGTNDGRLFEWDGSREAEITPLLGRSKPKDVQKGRISFIRHRGDKLAVGYEVGQPYLLGPRAAALGIRFFVNIATIWTEITAGVTDGSFATPVAANMNAWGGAATDRLLVMSPVPLAGIIPRVTRQANAAINSFTNPKGTSSGTETAGALSVNLGNVIDSTILYTQTTNNVSLAFTGFPPSATDPLLSWDSISAYANTGRSPALTITGIAGSPFANVYAYEFSPATLTPMTATTTIDEIDVILARPGLGLNDASGPFVAANDFSSLWQSGMLTDIYFGTPRGTMQYEWSNPYSVWTKGGGVYVASWTSAATGAMSNGGQGFLLYGRFAQFIIAEGQTRDPRRIRYPRLCQWTATTPGPQLAINDIVFRTSDGKLADPDRPKRIIAFVLDGEDIQPADMLKPLVNYRRNRGWHKFPTIQGPAPLISPASGDGLKGGGKRANVRILFSDGNQTDLWAPILKRVAVQWEYVDMPAKEAPAETVAVE